MRRWILVVVVVLVATTLAPVGAAAVDTQVLPSIPCDGQTPPSDIQALVPAQARARYDLQPLWDAGFRGRGVRVAIVELGTAVDADYLAAYQACLGQEPVPFFAHQVSHEDPPPPTPMTLIRVPSSASSS